MLTVALQQSINGVVFGSLYVLVALGLTLIYGVLVQINFAHADIVTIGAFAAYFFTAALGGNYIAGIGVALLVGAALGWLVNEVIRLWGGTFITWQNLIIVIVSTLTIALLYAFMKWTFMGKALRAVAQDRETAGLVGINPGGLVMLTFVIASALAGMAGAMLGPVLVLTPFAGTTVIVKAFAIVIIGGFGNVEGTIIAGLLVGLIESATTQLVNPGLTDIVVFSLLLLMLAVRPTGLIAEKREENV